MESQNMGNETEGVSYTIYIINLLSSVYIGSTSNFKQRRNEHISRCHNQKSEHYNYTLYKYIRELENKAEFKFDKNCFDVEFIIFNCDKEVVLKYEKETLEKFKNKGFKILNKNSPLQTEEELKAYMKAYNQSEKGKACQKAFLQSEKGKAYMKAYEQSEKRKAVKKAYYEKNKERAILLQRLRRAKKKLQK